MSDNRSPAYYIITQESAPNLFSQSFDLIESRYTRRSRYIEDISKIIHDVNRLNMQNDYTPVIDSEGNILFG